MPICGSGAAESLQQNVGVGGVDVALDVELNRHVRRWAVAAVMSSLKGRATQVLRERRQHLLHLCHTQSTVADLGGCGGCGRTPLGVLRKKFRVY